MTTTVEHHSPRAFVDPYAVDPYSVDAPEVAWPTPAGTHPDTDFLLPPPRPADRLHDTLHPSDQRRLDLHAALTAAGIPPHPEDQEAIDQLSTLSESINAALHRWLHHSA